MSSLHQKRRSRSYSTASANPGTAAVTARSVWCASVVPSARSFASRSSLDGSASARASASLVACSSCASRYRRCACASAHVPSSKSSAQTISEMGTSRRSRCCVSSIERSPSTTRAFRVRASSTAARNSPPTGAVSRLPSASYCRLMRLVQSFSASLSVPATSASETPELPASDSCVAPP